MKYVIGTRKSKLAMAQTEFVCKKLSEAYPEDEFVIQIVTTKGDLILDKPLHEIGDKGLFVKEIEEKILNREIDIGVHSMKDMPSVPAAGLMFTRSWKRENPRDVLILREKNSLKELAPGAVIGTGSKRREFQLERLRSDLNVVNIRERREDIPLLVSHFLLSNEENIGILPDAMNLLHNYDWPGNVRELRNIINRICILYSGKSVSADDIRPFLHNDFQVTEPLPPKNMTDARSAIISEICTLEEGEIALIKAALKEEHYNISNTAKILGITRATLYNKLKKYQIPYT